MEKTDEILPLVSERAVKPRPLWRGYKAQSVAI